MRDIETRDDIDDLVAEFYQMALEDPLIGYIFTDVAEINLEAHLPVIADFWEMLLFGTVNFQEKYRRSPMQVHGALNEKENLKIEHLARWLELFVAAVDGKFAGERAQLAKARAYAIANTMRLKFSAENDAAIRVRRG
jgi:hemoglobin